MSRYDIDLHGTGTAGIIKILGVVVGILAVIAAIFGVQEILSLLKEGGHTISLLALFSEITVLDIVFALLAACGVLQLFREVSTQFMSWAFLVMTLAGVIGVIFAVTAMSIAELAIGGVVGMFIYLVVNAAVAVTSIICLVFSMGKSGIALGVKGIVWFTVAQICNLVCWSTVALPSFGLKAAGFTVPLATIVATFLLWMIIQTVKPKKSTPRPVVDKPAPVAEPAATVAPQVAAVPVEPENAARPAESAEPAAASAAAPSAAAEPAIPDAHAESQAVADAPAEPVAAVEPEAAVPSRGKIKRRGEPAQKEAEDADEPDV